MKINLYSIVVFFAAVVLVFAESGMDTAQSEKKTDSISVPRYNPYVSGGVSLLLPGAGQFYTRHYFKGSLFLLGGGITAGVAAYQFNDANNYKKEKRELFSMAKTDIGNADSILQAAESKEYDERRARYRGYNAIAWGTGVYVFSLLDAVSSTGVIDKTGERSPLRAGLLSAIPGLGLGQWYNGSLSKAGMIFMGQMSLGVVAANYHRLMNKADREYTKVRDTLSTDNTYEEKWDSERNSAFKYRNSYMWYSLFYYFYGIFDAVVDAHLHDYPEKMRLYPDLAPKGDGAQLRFEMNF